MNRIFWLTKVFLKNSGNIFANLSSSRKSHKPSSPKKRLGLTLLLVALFLTVAISFFSLGYSSLIVAVVDADGASIPVDMDYVESLLKIVTPYLFLFLFIFMNTLIISIFFLTDDNHVFLPMPLKPYEIFLARLFSCLITAYLLELIFFAPLAVSYDVVIQPGFLVYINQIIYFITLPLIPVSLTFLASLIIAKVSHIERHRESFSVIISVISIFLIIGLQIAVTFIMPSSGISESPDLYHALKDQIANYGHALGWFDAVGQFVRVGLMDSGWKGSLYAFIFAISSLSVLFFTSLAANYFYQKFARIDFTLGKRKRNAQMPVTSLSKKKPRSVFALYLSKEWKMIKRSPNYLLQLVFPPIIVLLALGVSLGTIYLSDASARVEMDQLLEAVKEIVSPSNGGLPFLFVGASFLLGPMIMTSSTAFSREGKQVYLVKILPIAPSIQIRAKVSLGIIIETITMFVISLLVCLIFSSPWYVPFLVFIPTVASTIIAHYIMILFDLRHPFLDWSNELAPIKQNRTVFLTILLLFAIGLAFFGLGALFTYVIKIAIYWTIPILVIILGLTIYLIDRGIKKRGSAILERLQ